MEKSRKLTVFILSHCPHCRLALSCLEQLRQEPRYKNISVELIDESKEKALADRFDYYFVPSFFAGQVKLHEGHAELADVRGVLEMLCSTEE